MAKRGRPPVTRRRVLTYIARHHPKTVMQIVRATGADRRHVYRILMETYGPNFRSEWGCGAEMGFGYTSIAKAA